MTPLFAENVVGEFLFMVLMLFLVFLCALPSMIARRREERRLRREAVEEEWKIVYTVFGDMQGRTVKLAVQRADEPATTLIANSEVVDAELAPGTRVRVTRTGDRIWSVRKID